MARVIDDLSFEKTPDSRKYINYRDLSVQQLGSIYERLLEYPVMPEAEGGIRIEPNAFARKGSGSYYTPDDSRYRSRNLLRLQEGPRRRRPRRGDRPVTRPCPAPSQVWS